MAEPKPIVLGNFQRGIAVSPHFGISDMRNIDINSEPGVAKINEKAQARTEAQRTTTFTANVNDQITTVGTITPSNDADNGLGRAVTLTSSGSLPAGLALNTTYFLINITPYTVFKLATTYANAIAGTAVDITDTGTGTHTITTLEMGIPQKEATDPTTGSSFIVDNNGRIWYDATGFAFWRLIEGNTRSGGTGQGISVAYDHLFVFRATTIDVMIISSLAWTNGWQTTLTSATHHKTFIKDGIIYFGNGRYVGSIEEVGTFAPSNAATYTFDVTALDLPKGFVVGPISELGSKLVPFASRAGLSRAFPWTTNASDSYDGDFPVPGSEVYDAKNILNTLYIAAGQEGNIYSSVGTVANLFMQLPGFISGIPGSNISAKIENLQYFQHRIFFTVTSIGAYSSIGLGASGVWSVEPQTRILNCENIISSGSYGATSGVSIPLLHKPTDTRLHIGWRDADANTQGLDSLGEGTFVYYTSYLPYIIFELLQVGNAKNQSTLATILFELTKVLTSGQGVRLSYRTNTSASFTTIGTYDFATIGGLLSYFADSGIQLAEVLQIKAELTSPGTQTTPKLRTVQLLP